MGVRLSVVEVYQEEKGGIFLPEQVKRLITSYAQAFAKGTGGSVIISGG